MRMNSGALPVAALLVSVWGLIFLAAEPNSLVVLGATILVAVTAATLLAPRGRLLAVVAVNSGPPESASRRRRGDYLRQSNPDTAGRPRPRAPGVLLA
ncbi:DUF6412 domain-containing protein [Nocardia huaxiensis]|uniref:Uncharacterized protein n=1 Tax=Nocardia huaxiensis TaxID=2755382 RepID=A0A7D6VPE1_9NOCA|nr:DUF6412 domain-containing protein [Nocardia huaxiensis]QLY34456.1 hypothetical protein H0264_17030 [Nocardia huaxiensis]UFS99993.1 DUF6412 domain-containing protein [Nocardia huaxiensis]